MDFLRWGVVALEIDSQTTSKEVNTKIRCRLITRTSKIGEGKEEYFWDRRPDRPAFIQASWANKERGRWQASNNKVRDNPNDVSHGLEQPVRLAD